MFEALERGCPRPHPLALTLALAPAPRDHTATESMLSLTVRDFIGPLSLFINHDDNHQDDDLCQDPQEGPERSQLAADAQGGGPGHVLYLVGRVAGVLSGILADVQVDDNQFRVVLFIGNEETARGIVDVLKTK